MSADIFYFSATAEFVRAELDGGIVIGGAHAELVGRPRYFVDMIDAVGGRLGIWDGASYDEAREILLECRRDGMSVEDLIGGAT